MAFLVPLAGILLALSILASLATGLANLPQVVPGILQLISGVILWPHVPARVRRQSLYLVLVGCVCLLASTQTVSLTTAFSKNHPLIAMIAAIGMLRRVQLSKDKEDLPQGQKALWQTLFGVHFLGSAINVSALAIFADHLVDTRGRLQSFQGVMLARGFSLAALWSPFFVAMGVALTYAPGANYRTLMLWGIPLSQFLLAAMIRLVIRQKPKEVAKFQGYPFRLAALIGPLILTTTVLLGHFLFPTVSIIILITLLTPIYSLLANLNNRPLQILSQYICRDMTGMGPEIVLFVSAGILGSGLSSLVAGYSMNLNGGQNQILLVSAGLAIILAASCVGIHPVVGITVVSGVLAVANIPPTLLAMSFLISWALGVLINPISGIHLFLSGRYAFDARNAWRWNFRFVGLAYAIGCAWLYLFSLT